MPGPKFYGSFQVDFFSLSHCKIVACKFWAWRPVARDRSCQRRISGASRPGRAVIRPCNCIVVQCALRVNLVGDCSKCLQSPVAQGMQPGQHARFVARQEIRTETLRPRVGAKDGDEHPSLVAPSHPLSFVAFLGFCWEIHLTH